MTKASLPDQINIAVNVQNAMVVPGLKQTSRHPQICPHKSCLSLPEVSQKLAFDGCDVYVFAVLVLLL